MEREDRNGGTLVMQITRYKGRHWAVWNADGSLLCVCVYRRGANAVLHRLHVAEDQAVYALPECKSMGNDAEAFPAPLVAAFLPLLPPNERPVFARRFEQMVAELVWIRAEVKNALQTAFREEGESIRSPTLLSEWVATGAGCEQDDIVRLITESLQEAARCLEDTRLDGCSPE